MNTAYKVCFGVAFGASLLLNYFQRDIHRQLNYKYLCLKDNEKFMNKRHLQLEDEKLKILNSLESVTKEGEIQIDFEKNNNLEKKYDDYLKTLLESEDYLKKLREKK